MDDPFHSPEGSAGPASTDVADLNWAKALELVDTSNYARQLSAHLGVRFKPLHATEESARQAVFCFLILRLPLFANGKHLTLVL